MEKTTVQKICNGIVIIKNFLSIDQQNELIEKIIDPMIDGKFFWNDKGELNFMKIRGRHYCKIADYENNKLLDEIAARAMKLVTELDDTIPATIPTHLLSLWYQSNYGVGWHRDVGGNNGDLDTAVISLTIGRSCVFEYKIDKSGTEEKSGKQSVQLDSGDLIVFGGEQRAMIHRVKKVLNDALPKELNLKHNVRINLTLRQSREIIGQEDYYSNEKYAARLVAQRNNINNDDK